MPTLVFTEGDTAEIYVHNLFKEENIFALARLIFTQQRRWRTQSYANAYQTKYYTYLPFPIIQKWYIGIIRILDYKNK